MTTTTTTKPTASYTPAERIALTADTNTLRHALRALNNDMEQAIKAGVRGTQAHVGMLEMMEAFSRELRLRSAD